MRDVRTSNASATRRRVAVTAAVVVWAVGVPLRPVCAAEDPPPRWTTAELLRAHAVTEVTATRSLQPRMRLDAFLQPGSEPSSPGAPGLSKSRYALPMFLSAVVPGAGEISMGHWWRGLPLVAADVATWLGYAHYNSEGNSLRDEYETFADTHWDEDRWQTNLIETRFWDTSAPWNCDCSPPYIPPDEDLREYYENLGKYEQFFGGWEDWTTEYDPEDPQSLRRIYSDMRIESNKNLDNASRMLGVAALTRVVSVVQSFWLVRRESRSEGLVFEPFTFRGFGSGLRVTTSF